MAKNKSKDTKTSKVEAPPKEGGIFEVKCSSYYDARNGQHSKRGDLVRSKHPLDEHFPNAFARVEVEKVEAFKAKLAAVPDEDEEDCEDEEECDFGDDVTSEFDKAEAAGCKVFCNEDGEHTIVSCDEPTEPLKICPNKAKAEAFLGKRAKVAE